eukprot:403339361
MSESNIQIQLKVQQQQFLSDRDSFGQRLSIKGVKASQEQCQSDTKLCKYDLEDENLGDLEIIQKQLEIQGNLNEKECQFGLKDNDDIDLEKNLQVQFNSDNINEHLTHEKDLDIINKRSSILINRPPPQNTHYALFKRLMRMEVYSSSENPDNYISESSQRNNDFIETNSKLKQYDINQQNDFFNYKFITTCIQSCQKSFLVKFDVQFQNSRIFQTRKSKQQSQTLTNQQQ